MSDCTGFQHGLLCVPRANTSNKEIKVASWGKMSIGFLSERSIEVKETSKSCLDKAQQKIKRTADEMHGNPTSLGCGDDIIDPLAAANVIG